MPTFDAVFVGKITLPDVSTGPVPVPPGFPAHPIAPGGGVVMPPIYLPVVPPGAPEHPIYIPVYPSHPIVLPPEHVGGPPVVWPPLPPLTIWPEPQPPYVDIGGPAQPPPLGIWGGGGVPMPNPPIYIPIVPPPVEGAPPEATHPIYLPVYPTHPIYLPGHPEHPIVIPPELPPAFVSPPAAAPGYWGYSPYYNSPVFVPYAGAAPPGAPSAPAAGRR
jgi:hypothetical protein